MKLPSTVFTDAAGNAALQTLNTLGLLGISLSLSTAFYYQLAYAELPCPLCLLQRAGFAIAGLGFLFNIRLGERLSHYAMILAGCLVTGCIAMRQVLLHIAPNDPGYGSTLFGLHFYTWACVFSGAILVYVMVVLALKDVLRNGSFGMFSMAVRVASYRTRWVAVLFVGLVIANGVSTVLECGAGQCADNPTQYLLLH